MASLPQLLAAHESAVADYTVKLAAFKSSYIELAALDRALSSQRVGHAQNMPGFGPMPDVISLRHQRAAPNEPAWFDAFDARFRQIMAEFPTPDEE
jgi:hypothetical protein